MIALAMVVLGVRADSLSKMALPERDDLRQALRPDRSDEALSIGVQVGTSGGEPHGPDTRALQDARERLREQ